MTGGIRSLLFRDFSIGVPGEFTRIIGCVEPASPRPRPSAFHLSFPFSSSGLDGTKMEYIKDGNLLGIQRS